MFLIRPSLPVASRSLPDRLTLPELLLVSYCLLVPLVPQLSVAGLPIGVTEILLPPSLLAVLLRGRWRPYPSASFLVLYVTVSAISVLAIVEGSARSDAALRVVRLAGIVVPFLLGVTVARPTPRLLRLCTLAFIGSGALSLTIGVVSFLLQTPAFLSPAKFVYPILGYVHRAGGISGGSSGFGHLIATWLGVSLFLLPALGPWRTTRAILPLAIGLASIALLSSLSRSAVLNITAALGAAVTVNPRTRRGVAAHLRKISVRTVFLMGVAVAIILVWVGGELLELVRSRLFFAIVGPVLGTETLAEVSSGRIGNWADYLPLLGENPLTGVGYKSLILVYELPPDNNYLQALVETGTLGFVAILGFLLSLVRTFHARVASGIVPGWPFFVIWCGQLANAFFVDIMTFWVSTPALLALTAVGLRLCSTRTFRSRPVGR